ncbi:hypothetical protein LEMLEM_LOCUS21353, partial [Lemmus lemmus]
GRAQQSLKEGNKVYNYQRFGRVQRSIKCDYACQEPRKYEQQPEKYSGKEDQHGPAAFCLVT